jgi:cell division protein FtsB
MNHQELIEKIDQRFDKTDAKIDALQRELHEYSRKTAVLEAQMSGLTSIGLLIVASTLGVLAYIFQKGI